MQERRRRTVAVVLTVATMSLFLLFGLSVSSAPQVPRSDTASTQVIIQATDELRAIDVLETLIIKGRAPKTDYSRDQFGSGWSNQQGCDTRNIILNRDMTNVSFDANCNVTQGMLYDPYTGKIIQFTRGVDTSDDVQIDHVVALSDAWQKGAQQLTRDQRIAFANDPLELLAVDGPANQQKSDGDAATWLPAHKPFRCQYIARQIAVKQKYSLWITQAEYSAMSAILTSCPEQALPR